MQAGRAQRYKESAQPANPGVISSSHRFVIWGWGTGLGGWGAPSPVVSDPDANRADHRTLSLCLNMGLTAALPSFFWPSNCWRLPSYCRRIPSNRRQLPTNQCLWPSTRGTGVLGLRCVFPPFILRVAPDPLPLGSKGAGETRAVKYAAGQAAKRPFLVLLSGRSSVGKGSTWATEWGLGGSRSGGGVSSQPACLSPP